MTSSHSHPRRHGVVVLGDTAGLDVPGLERRYGATQPLLVVATRGATTAEVASVQLPRLAELDPAVVLLQMGDRDLLDGFDESYVHARLVEICDGIRRLAPLADVEVVGIAADAHDGELGTSQWDTLRRQCNSAAEVTARLRGFGWRDL